MSRKKQGVTKDTLQLSINKDILSRIKVKAEKENFKISNRVELFFEKLLAETQTN